MELIGPQGMAADFEGRHPFRRGARLHRVDQQGDQVGAIHHAAPVQPEAFVFRQLRQPEDGAIFLELTVSRHRHDDVAVLVAKVW